MSLSDRRFFLAVLLALPACGFTPVHGPDGGGTALRGRVELASPEDRAAYDFVKRFEERLGRAGDGAYTLDYRIETRTEGVGVTSQQEITRYQLFGTLSFTLTDKATGQALADGAVESFTAYSSVSAATQTPSGGQVSTVAFAAAERDAHRRLMVALADLLVARLYAVVPGA